MTWTMLSAVLVVALAVIAAVVAVWQYGLGSKSRSGCWWLIVLYWAVLTVKNLCDFWGR